MTCYVSNVKTINDAVRNELSQFDYDDLNRLTSASITGVYSQAWLYDSIGNISWRKDNGTTTTYSYGDSAHAHAVTYMGALYYCYDANGSMTGHAATNSACTSGGDTLAYDAENRLISDTHSGTTTYVYDGDGNRLNKSVGSTVTYYVGNSYEVTGSTTTKYYYPSTVPFGKLRMYSGHALAQRVAIKQSSSKNLNSTARTTEAASTRHAFPCLARSRRSTHRR